MCGFNTKALEFDQTLVRLKVKDLFLSDGCRLSESQEVLIEVSDYC